MTVQDIRRATVIGCGMIGPDIGACLLMSGIRVHLVGRDDNDVAAGAAKIREGLADLVKAEVITAEESEDALGLVQTSTDIPTAVADADVIFEAVFEDLAVKQAVFAQIDGHCGQRAILCSSTSGLSPNDIGAHIRHQDRMMVTHFWNPPHLVPLVEVVPHARLSDEVRRLAIAFIEKLGKVPVALKRDIPGHIGNRLQHALYREALYLIEQGVADPSDIDTVILASFGPRFSTVGAMEYFDSCGLDLHEKVQSYLFPTLCNAAAPQEILTGNIRAGNLGQKTGRGLFDWSTKDQDLFRRLRNERFIQMLKAGRGVSR